MMKQMRQQLGRCRKCRVEVQTALLASIILYAPAKRREHLTTENQISRALTAKELARLLGVSAITIFKQAKAGSIPCFRIGTPNYRPERPTDAVALAALFELPPCYPVSLD